MGIQMKRGEPTKKFMMISNIKLIAWFVMFRHFKCQNNINSMYRVFWVYSLIVIHSHHIQAFLPALG